MRKRPVKQQDARDVLRRSRLIMPAGKRKEAEGLKRAQDAMGDAHIEAPEPPEPIKPVVPESCYTKVVGR